MTLLSIRIREGRFGANFGPNFDIVTGGGIGMSMAMLAYILNRGRKAKSRKASPDLLKLMRILKTLKSLGLLDHLSWPVTVNG